MDNEKTLEFKKAIGIKFIDGQRINKKNTSGYPGVSFEKKTGLWFAYIHVDRDRIFLGRFASKEDAIAIRKKAAAERQRNKTLEFIA